MKILKKNKANIKNQDKNGLELFVDSEDELLKYKDRNGIVTEVSGGAELGNYSFNTTQAPGAGEDNYVLTYDNATGLIQLEASGGAFLPLAGGTMTGTIDASGITANGDGTGGKVLKYGDLLVQMGEYGLDDFSITTDNGGFAERYFYLDNVQIVISHNASASITVDTNGTSIAGSVGFHGATPISKQNSGSQTPATFVANTSGISDDTATWDGYTVGDIVAILQAYNLIT